MLASIVEMRSIQLCVLDVWMVEFWLLPLPILVWLFSGVLRGGPSDGGVDIGKNDHDAYDTIINCVGGVGHEVVSAAA